MVLKKIGRVITKIFLIFCIIILIAEIWIIIQSITNKDKIPSIFGVKPMIVLSGSMETEINSGDLAIIKNINVKDLKKGDVIAYRSGKNIVTTHRIVEIEKNNDTRNFTTKGDNNEVNDLQKVTEKQVEGKYIFKIPKLGNFLMYIKEPSGLIAIILIILILGLIWIII